MNTIVKLSDGTKLQTLKKIGTHTISIKKDLDTVKRLHIQYQSKKYGNYSNTFNISKDLKLRGHNCIKGYSGDNQKVSTYIKENIQNIKNLLDF